MKASLPLLLSLALLAVLVHARVAKANADTDQTNIALLRYSRCVIDRTPREVTELLSALNWDTKTNPVLEAFSQRTGRCVKAGQRLTADDNLIRGLFAGALFIKRNKNTQLRDYSNTPLVFESRTVPEGAKMRLPFLTFGECVFRANPRGVNTFLNSKPGSVAETGAVGELSPNFSRCLSAEDGKQVISRISIRGVLGEAAYAVDSAPANSLSEHAGGK